MAGQGGGEGAGQGAGEGGVVKCEIMWLEANSINDNFDTYLNFPLIENLQQILLDSKIILISITSEFPPC